MEENSKVYRIRTKVGEDSPNVIHVPINQTYDTFEILSLKLNQTDTYKTYESGYGIIVGRVIANGGFGVPNSKVSVFIEVDDNESLKDTLLYNFTSTSDTDNDGVRYNLLPDYVEAECHQDVGTFPNKRLVLDNDDVIEIFDKYWKYTTTTNNSGDYMLFGIPTGSQQLHVDIDLSDCGVLSQRPHNMIGKGYDIGMFESPNKFKSSTNLNSLPQIVTEDRGVYVYPYWGDTSNGDNTFAITRCDINIEYKFEPTAVFMGSIITDKGSNAIGKNCTATINNGKMSELVTGEGTIEMIRKTIDGRVEQFPIMGNRLIDGDGTWVYEIPMNLDYVTTDEFGNFVPTDNPDKGIATRARVRFRVRLDDTQYDNTARKRACYLIPNNPRLEDEGFDKTMEVDYEFGSLTREESYRDLFWNKVYTVKSYIPKIQKGDEQYNRQHTGIKWVNHANQNNPMPYNTLTVKLSFVHRIICILTGLVVQFVAFINQLISTVSFLLAVFIHLPSALIKGMAEGFGEIWVVGPAIEAVFKGVGDLVSDAEILGGTVVKKLTPKCIVLDRGFCDDNVNKKDYYPGCGWFLFYAFEFEDVAGVISDANIAWRDTKKAHEDKYKNASPDEAREPENDPVMLHNCYENALAQENEATSFNFNNDWINGTLYAPLWYRKITPKKRFFFGLFSRKAKDEWCSSKQYFPSLRYIQHCAIERDGSKTITNFDGDTTDLKFVRNSECDNGDCHERHVALPGLGGVIHSKKTMLGQDVYYYKPVEWSANLPSNELYTGKKKGELKLLFATDIVLLGSLDSCDMNGIPQFFKNLESTTYNMPGDILFTDYEFHYVIDPETGKATSNINTLDSTVHSEMAGCDWGNPNEFNKKDGGLFYGIGCTNGDTELYAKSCVNLSRICEYGVSLDVTKQIPILEKWNEETSESEIEQAEDGAYYKRLITDGFISWDELYNLDERSMFATMNGNQLKTKINTKNGLKEYDFRYLYPENFDGSLAERMKRQTQNYPPEINYKYNYLLEKASRDYYLFRMGNKPYYYDSNNAFPRYENSFYFYFGLNEGKTAIEKFNSKYFAECDNEKGVYNNFNIYKKSSSWCSSLNNTYDGFIALDLEKIATPYSIVITGDNTFTLDNITHEKIIFYNEEKYSIPEGFEDYVPKEFEEVNTFIPNGAYYLTITDANEEEYHYELDMNYNFLMYSNNVQSFKKNHEDLLRSLGTNNAIMNDNIKLVYSNPEKIEREIGGVITVYGVHDNDGDIDTYRIEVREKVDFDITDIQKTIEKKGDTWYDADGNFYKVKSIDDDGTIHYTKNGKGDNIDKKKGDIVEDYDGMKKELIIPEWYDKEAVKHYLTEKRDRNYVYEEGTQQADFNPLVKELTFVGYTWYDKEDNVYNVTSIVLQGKEILTFEQWNALTPTEQELYDEVYVNENGEEIIILTKEQWEALESDVERENYVKKYCNKVVITHYTKNDEGDYRGRVTWYDADGYFCKVTKIVDGIIYYTKNVNVGYIWYDADGKLCKTTNVVPQEEEILTVEQWEGLTPTEKEWYVEVYVKENSEETIILTKEQWEALAPDERDNYTKMYRNKYVIIHYTINGEGDYTIVDYTIVGRDTVVDYTDWTLELNLPTYYDKNGEKQYYPYQPNKETSVIDFELSDRLKKVTDIKQQHEEILTVEEWNSLSTEEKTLYEEVYVNKTDETDIRSKKQWEALAPDERDNYDKKYRNKYTIIHYTKNGETIYRGRDTWYDADGVKHTASSDDIGRTLVDYSDWVLELTPPTWYDLDGYFCEVTKIVDGTIYYTKNVKVGDTWLDEDGALCKVTSIDVDGTIHYTKNGEGNYTIVDYTISNRKTVTEVTFNSSLENAPYLEHLYNLYKGEDYVEKYDLVNSDGVEYGISYKVISPYALTTDDYGKLTDYGKFDYEQKYVTKPEQKPTVIIIDVEDYNGLPDDYGQKSYDEVYVNKTDERDIRSKEQWEELDPDERGNYDKKYKNKYDATIISSDDWDDLPDAYCKEDYEEKYVNKKKEEDKITKAEWEGLSDGYGQNHYKEEPSYCKIENKTEHITKEEYDDNVDIQFLYQQFHVLNENNILIENGYGKTLKEEYTKIIVNYNDFKKVLDLTNDIIKFYTKKDKEKECKYFDGEGWKCEGNIIKGNYIIDYQNLKEEKDNGEVYYDYKGNKKTVETTKETVLDFTSLVRVLSFETWLDEDGALCEVTSITPQGENILTDEQWSALTTDEKTLYDEVYVNKTDSSIIISKEQWEALESEEERAKYDKKYSNKLIIHYTKNDEGDYTIVGRNTVINYNQPIWTKTTRSDDNYSWVDKNGVTQYKGAETLVVDYSWLLETTTQEEIMWYDKEGNVYKVTSVVNGVIHYTINGKGDNTDKKIGDIVVDFNHDKIVLTLDEIGDTWYDEDGNFCEVTSIDTNGIHYTKNGEEKDEEGKPYIIDNRDTVVNYYKFMTEPLYLPTWYDAKGNLYKVTSIGDDGSTIHYSINGEGDYTIVGRDTVVDWSKYIGYEGAEITYDNGVITNITNVLWYDSEKQSFAFGVPDENRTYIITVTQLCNVGDTVFETKNRIETNVFVSGVIKYKMFINGIDYEIIKNFDGHTGWSYNGTITKNKLTTNVSDLNENNPWFNVDKIYYHNNFGGNNDYPEIKLKDIERFGIDKNESEQTYAIYATEIDKEDEEVGKKVNETYHGEDGKNKTVKAEDVIATFVNKRNEDKVTTYKVIDFTVKNLMFVGETWYDDDDNLCKTTNVVPQEEEILTVEQWNGLSTEEKTLYVEVYVNKQDSSVIAIEVYNQLPDEYGQKSYDVYQYVNETDSDIIISKEDWESLESDEEREKYESYTYVNKYDETIINSQAWNGLSPDYCKEDYDKMYRNKYAIVHYTKNGVGDYTIVGRNTVVDYSDWLITLNIIISVDTYNQLPEDIQNSYDEVYVNKQGSSVILPDAYNQLPDYNQDCYEEVYVNKTDERDIRSKEDWEELGPDERDNYNKKYKNKYKEDDIIDPEDWVDLTTGHCKRDYDKMYRNKNVKTDIKNYFKQYRNKQVPSEFISTEAYNRLPKNSEDSQNGYDEVYVNKQNSNVIMPEAYNQLDGGYSQKSYDVYEYVNKQKPYDIITKKQWEGLSKDERDNYKPHTYVNKYDATKIITSDVWNDLPKGYCKGDYAKMYCNKDVKTKFITPVDWSNLPKYCQEDYTQVYLSTWYDKNGTLNYMLPSEEGQERIDFRPLVKTIKKEGETWYDVNSVKRVAGSDDIGQEVLDYSKENNGLTELKEITFETSDKTWYDKNGIVKEADSDKLGLYIDITYMTKGGNTILFNIHNKEYIDKLVIDKVDVYCQDSYDEVYVKNDGTEILTKEQWEALAPDVRDKYVKKYKNKYVKTEIITPEKWNKLPKYSNNGYTCQYNFNRNGLHSVRIYLAQETTYGHLLSDVIDFNGCSELNTIVLPNIGINTIGANTFKNCKSLTSIDLPDSITTIDEYAFNGCEKLSSVYIPYNVTTIGANAFNGCKSLTNIVLPKKITKIGENAFANCEKLQSVRAEMKDVANTTVGTNAFDNTNIGLIIYVPMDKDGKLYDVSTTPYNKAGWGNVKEKVVAIELTVFNYNKVNINPSDLLDEFARNTSGNTNGNTVYYNFIDSYVAGEYKAFTQVTYFKASDFVNTINNVLSRRREIADRMLKTFYMTEEGVSKNFEITSNTDEMPVQPIIVYHEEEVDDESEYILTNANLTYEQTNMLQNVNIPTITYKSSPFFGDGTSSDEIMITKSNNIEKKPSSTGIMNVKQKSIPLDSGNKDFPSISLSGGVKAINPSKTNIVDLFEFPVIDKIESSSVSGWTKFSNIPSPNPNNIGMINMDGYVYGRHNNGVVERDGNFEIKKLGKYEINLSENLNNNTKPYTYAERRVITGLTNYSIAQWCIVKLRNIVQADDVTEETLKNIWKMLFNPTNEEDKPTNYKETLLEVIDTMTVLKQTIDENLIIYIQCDETIGVTPNKWEIDQGDENCITNSLIQFKKFNVVDIDNERQYAFTDAKKANLNIGEINENFNFDNELKLSTEVESIDTSGQSHLNIPSLTKLSFNQGEKEGGHYQLYALSDWMNTGGPYYSKEDMSQYPLYKAYKATNNGIAYQIDNVEEETLLSHEGEILKTNDKEKKITWLYNLRYVSTYFYSMYKFKGSNDDERVRLIGASTNGLFIAEENFNRIYEDSWTFNWHTARIEYRSNVTNDYFFNPNLIRHVYCVYVKGNMKMLSPLYEFAPTQLVGTWGQLESYDGRNNSVIGIKVNDYARVYFKNYDYTLGGPFKIKRKNDYLTYTIPEGTIKYKDEEYYYKIVDKLEDDVYTFEYNMGWRNEGHNFHEDHVIAKDITDLPHLTWTNGNELSKKNFILIKWVVPESDSFRFISEQKNTETEDFVELATVEKVYRTGQILTRLPKNNGQYKDSDYWTIQYKEKTEEETEEGTKVVTKVVTKEYETSALLNGKFEINRPYIITKKI